MLAEIIGPDGLILIVVAALVLLFGGSRVPRLARSLGAAKSEFEKGVKDGAAAPDETKP